VRRRGFSLLEFVLVAVLIVAVFAASAVVLSSTTRRQAEGEARDSADRIGFQTLEQARALGCGLGTGDQTVPLLHDGNLDPDKEGDTQARARRCRAILAPDVDPANNAYTPGADPVDASWATDPPAFQVTRNQRVYTVALTTAWFPARTPSADSTPPDCTANGTAQPGLLRRTVTVTWNLRGPRTRTLTAWEAVPPDAAAYHDPSDGGLLVEAADGVPVSVHPASTPATTALRRVADSAACVWFPFLPEGSYTVTRNGTDTTVAVTAGTQVVVP
jgi:type II secretory pathway pseudopilin PulG